MISTGEFLFCVALAFGAGFGARWVYEYRVRWIRDERPQWKAKR